MDTFALWVGRLVIGFSCGFVLITAALHISDKVTNRIWRKMRSTHDLLLLKRTMRQLHDEGRLKLTEKDAE